MRPCVKDAYRSVRSTIAPLAHERLSCVHAFGEGTKHGALIFRQETTRPLKGETILRLQTPERPHRRVEIDAASVDVAAPQHGRRVLGQRHEIFGAAWPVCHETNSNDFPQPAARLGSGRHQRWELRQTELVPEENREGGEFRTGRNPHPNFPVRGNPFGTIRPAVARAPSHSTSSACGLTKTRPALSVHDSPSASVKVFASSAPPSL
jgi:hypothetical protein